MDAGDSFHRISILEILDRSFSFYIDRIENFFPIFLLLNVANIFLVYTARFVMPKFNPPYGSLNDLLIWLINYGSFTAAILSILFLATWIITNIGNSMVIGYALDVFEGRRASIRESITLISHLLWKVLAISLITGILIALGFLLLILPGIIMMVIFSLSIPALIYEQTSVFSSLRRSKELTNNRWWRVFLLLLAIFIIFAVIYLLIEVLTIPFNQINQHFLIKEIIRVIIISLIEPIYPVNMAYLYYYLREQKIYPPREVKFCYICGQILPYDAIYCPNCGRRIS
ncbi:MAG: YciC family protein [Candidatus Bathyarchaeia archaeon]